MQSIAGGVAALSRPSATLSPGERGGSKIDATVVDVPLDQHDQQRHHGQRPPPFLADGLGVPGAGDRAIADLDLVRIRLAGGTPSGTRPRGAMSLSRGSNRFTAKGKRPSGSQRAW